MEVGRLTPNWFRILVGDTVDYTEVRGWRKTGRPKQVNPSFTELKTVRCIIDGPELEDIYKIAEMSKSSLGDKTVAFTSTSVKEEMKSGPRSELIDAAIEEIYNTEYASGDEISNFDDLMLEESDPFPQEQNESNLEIMDMSKAFASDEIKQSASSSHGEKLKSVVTHEVIGPANKKMVVKMNFGSQTKKRKAMKALAALHGIETIHVDTKDGTLTIIGDVNPASVLFLLNTYEKAEIISYGPEDEPAEEHEAEIGSAYEPEKEHKTGPFSKNTSGCTVL